MTRWIPAPLPAIHAANRHRWTTENPAPEVVGYLIVWSDLQEGRRPSRRSMAEHLGVAYHTLIAYYYRQRRPSPEVGFRIEESTNGRVSMRDFYPSAS